MPSDFIGNFKVEKISAAYLEKHIENIQKNYSRIFIKRFSFGYDSFLFKKIFGSYH